MPERNQNPEQIARDNIDRMLEAAGWVVQHSKKIDFRAGLGIAVREYQTDVGPADYALFVDQKAVGIIEAKPESWGQNLTTVEDHPLHSPRISGFTCPAVASVPFPFRRSSSTAATMAGHAAPSTP